MELPQVEVAYGVGEDEVDDDEYPQEGQDDGCPCELHAHVVDAGFVVVAFSPKLFDVCAGFVCGVVGYGGGVLCGCRLCFARDALEEDVVVFFRHCFVGFCARSIPG